MGFLLSFLLRPKVLLTTILTIAVLSGLLWYGSIQRSKGYADGSRTQLETDKQQFEQISQQYKDALAKAQSTIDSSNAKIASLDLQLQGLQVQFVALATQRQQGQGAVNKLPDSAVQGDLETKLGGPLSDPSILRKDDQIVTDYPLVLKQVDLLNTKVDDLSSKVQAISDKEGAVEKQRDAAIQFDQELVPLYVKAWNAAQVHHSKFIKIITFGLVHDRHLDIPNPSSLNARIPK